jgi:hypothetical protein
MIRCDLVFSTRQNGLLAAFSVGQSGEPTDPLEQRLVSLFLVQGFDRARLNGRCQMFSFVNADGVTVVG